MLSTGNSKYQSNGTGSKLTPNVEMGSGDRNSTGVINPKQRLGRGRREGGEGEEEGKKDREKGTGSGERENE